MQFTIAAAATLFSAVAFAAPGANVQVARQANYTPCSGLYGTAQCCATDVLGVADLDCANPTDVPTSGDNFSEVCSAIGQRARCCVLPILEQGILCNTPSGVQG
ncbi:Cerato-ulmin hydrophobin family [Apiospora sp. TS-2023a]|uniref:Cerato-ulmin hydrophobin family n=1 Tax=Apiospora saccharicola TaxID=335842 RepID=A0ABR1U2W8_9PEZI